MMSKRNFLNAIGLGGVAAALAGCSVLSTFNALTPKDGGIRRIARDVKYGDDPRQGYDVYGPARPGKPLPLLVFFYGGGWYSGSKNDYVWMGHALAALGYVVALPDYRVFPQVVYPAFLEDNAAAVKHLIAHAADYGADATRLALSGQSAGAYSAVMMALDSQYLGPGDPVKTCVSISGPYDFYPFDVKASKDTFGRWPRPLETQPISYARPTKTHFLFLQSRADKVVGVHNSVNLQAKLLADGDDCRLKLYDGLTHEDTAAVYAIPFRGKAPLYRDTQAFLAETL
ncbi:MAG: alpha/beta hydrolase [Asticcacaulis sp.]